MLSIGRGHRLAPVPAGPGECELELEQEDGRDMKKKWPSLPALSVFESTVRLGSMTAAAEEMGLSQPVVSQRIRALEDSLGVSLFDRRGGRLMPTRQGDDFYKSVAQGLQIIDDACRHARRAGQKVRPSVSIAAGAGFTHLCLLPRMPALKAAFPEFRFSVLPIDRDDDAEMQSADIAIRFGRRPVNDDAVRVAGEKVFPVCSPAYAARCGVERIQSIDDLARLALLHQDARDPRWLDWAQWARAVGIEMPMDEDFFAYRNYPLVLNAALEGSGVALGWEFVVEKHLARGQLVVLGPAVTREDHGYWMELKYSANAVTQPVKAWLINALQNTTE